MMHWKLVALLTFTPTVLGAQSVVTLSAFSEASGAFAAGTAVGAGGELGSWWSGFGTRMAVRVPIGGGAAERVWGGDADIALSPLRLHGSLEGLAPGGALPYAFVGFGAHVTQELREPMRLAPSRTWGLGVEMPLVGRTLSLYSEGRRRLPLTREDPALPGGWEFRGGMTVAIGRGARPPVTLAATVPVRPRDPSGAPVPMSEAARTVLGSADRFLGTRYQWGGMSPSTGFDCSGFVRHVFGEHGILLPRVTRDQAQVGEALPLDPAVFSPGDLLFFAGNLRVIDHVAIYVGDGRLIHATESGGRVRYDELGYAWYMRHLVAARRVL